MPRPVVLLFNLCFIILAYMNVSVLVKSSKLQNFGQLIFYIPSLSFSHNWKRKTKKTNCYKETLCPIFQTITIWSRQDSINRSLFFYFLSWYRIAQAMYWFSNIHSLFIAGCLIKVSSKKKTYRNKTYLNARYSLHSIFLNSLYNIKTLIERVNFFQDVWLRRIIFPTHHNVV